MEIISKTPERIILKLPISYQLANAIRRSVDEVATLAVDDVEFFRNDSALYDEMIAHRIGLVPMKTDSKMSSKTELDLKLKKTGPCTVYSGDLEGQAKAVHDAIPITVLEEGQQIELVATARLGKGVEHAKHVPGLAYYRHLLHVKSEPKIDKLVQSSIGAIKPQKSGSSWICDLPDAVINEINKIDSDAVKDSEEILFFIESWGQLDAEVIFRKAIEILQENLDEFEKLVK